MTTAILLRATTRCVTPLEEEAYQCDNQKGKRYFVTLPLSNSGQNFNPVRLQIDSASTCNTIHDTTLEKLGKVQLKRTRNNIKPYGPADPYPPLGTVDPLCEINGHFETLTFYVVPSHKFG